MFEIGKKVVCIRDNWKPKWFIPEEMPVKGEIYHVEDIREIDGYGICLKLRELTKTETVWRGENFRPVDYSFGEEVEERIKEEIQQESKAEPKFKEKA